MPVHDLSLAEWPTLLALAGVGAVASAINAVAGGGSLVSFPFLVWIRIPSLEANATNSAGLWPGALAGALGFLNLLHKAGHHLRALFFPTLVGSVLGAWLLVTSSQRAFEVVVPFLILGASVLLAFQPRIRAWASGPHGRVPGWAGLALQFLVAAYGGYFGAGMGIMMLAAFALYVDANVHELNAMKGWLGLVINFTSTLVFALQGRVLFVAGAALAAGAIVGGFAAARHSQRVDAEKLRVAIAAYGFATAGYFFWRAFG